MRMITSHRIPGEWRLSRQKTERDAAHTEKLLHWFRQYLLTQALHTRHFSLPKVKMYTLWRCCVIHCCWCRRCRCCCCCSCTQRTISQSNWIWFGIALKESNRRPRETHSQKPGANQWMKTIFAPAAYEWKWLHFLLKIQRHTTSVSLYIPLTRNSFNFPPEISQSNAMHFLFLLLLLLMLLLLLLFVCSPGFSCKKHYIRWKFYLRKFLRNLSTDFIFNHFRKCFFLFPFSFWLFILACNFPQNWLKMQLPNSIAPFAEWDLWMANQTVRWLAHVFRYQMPKEKGMLIYTKEEMKKLTTWAHIFVVFPCFAGQFNKPYMNFITSFMSDLATTSNYYSIFLLLFSARVSERVNQLGENKITHKSRAN